MSTEKISFKQLHKLLNGYVGRKILGVKDENMKFKFMTSNYWCIPIFLIIFILECMTPVLVIVTIFLIIFTIFLYCNEKSVIYFQNNCLIYENKLGNKKVIDITKQPIIYSINEKYTTRTGYFECRQEVYMNDGETLIRFTRVPTEKLYVLINNFILK